MKLKVIVRRAGRLFEATCPALPDCSAIGETPDAAVAAIEEEIRLALLLLERATTPLGDAGPEAPAYSLS